MNISEKSPIQKFYKNSTIFITGASGFLGTVLLEKLLRSCPDISTIYILLREKKNKTPEQRLDEIFDDNLWNTVRAQNPNYKNIVKIVNGELTAQRLGISEDDYAKLCNEVNVIFHVAATVKFDEPLKQAAKMNIEGTQMILELGKRCKNLKALVHISTAYTQCVKPTSKEIFYTPPREAEEFLTYCEQHTQEELDAQLSNILGKYPNTYTFTKAIAESLIEKYKNELPLAICRPSVVFGCAEAPIKGWAKGLHGPVGAMMGVGMGLIHAMPCNRDAITDIIPVDMCVNLMIVAAYETVKQPKKINIYNSVTSSENPITWREFYHWTLTFATSYPCYQAIWYYFIIFSANKKVLKVCQILFHIIPAFIVDSLLQLTGKKPNLLKIYEKVHKMLELVYIFKTTSWIFYNDNTRQLYENLDSRDQMLFNFDVKKIEWDIYLLYIVKFTRIVLLKEPLNNVMLAEKKLSKMKIAHFTLMNVFIALFCWLLYLMVKLFI